jgi:hypothetical protein
LDFRGLKVQLKKVGFIRTSAEMKHLLRKHGAKTAEELKAEKK